MPEETAKIPAVYYQDNIMLAFTKMYDENLQYSDYPTQDHWIFHLHRWLIWQAMQHNKEYISCCCSQHENN